MQTYKVPMEGGRGFLLAKWALQIGFLVIVLANVMLYLGKLDGSTFTTTLLLGSARCGIGPGGQMGSNIVERLPGKTQDPPKP